MRTALRDVEPLGGMRIVQVDLNREKLGGARLIVDLRQGES